MLLLTAVAGVGSDAVGVAGVGFGTAQRPPVMGVRFVCGWTELAGLAI